MMLVFTIFSDGFALIMKKVSFFSCYNISVSFLYKQKSENVWQKSFL